jgi:hypothetical protein
MDEVSDLIKVRREKTDIIYTIRFKTNSQKSADLLRNMQKADPRSMEVGNISLAKQRVCEPVPNPQGRSPGSAGVAVEV